MWDKVEARKRRESEWCRITGWTWVSLNGNERDVLQYSRPWFSVQPSGVVQYNWNIFAGLYFCLTGGVVMTTSWLFMTMLPSHDRNNRVSRHDQAPSHSVYCNLAIKNALRAKHVLTFFCALPSPSFSFTLCSSLICRCLRVGRLAPVLSLFDSKRAMII